MSRAADETTINISGGNCQQTNNHGEVEGGRGVFTEHDYFSGRRLFRAIRPALRSPCMMYFRLYPVGFYG
ncbi:hypothetical protein GCM10022409_07200 [Hymenobacter glaciei]|uniref:Uncharacterized protein n=1 Tax=Hymenobacter glaciei TaxID=877209 RepID=A0ABP7TGI3_9BACT